jgi:hypothetical protein
MKEQRITIEIDREGRITADADGFSGDACLHELERLLEGLAPGKATLERKPESGHSNTTAARTQSLGRKP